MHFRPLLTLCSAAWLVAACTSLPTGPTALALPGTGKSFDQFRYDDFDCREYALAQVGGKSANQSADNAAVKSAVVGTVTGAVAGAALGGHEGAGAGAGAGLIVGTMAGSGAAQSSSYGTQRQYDNAYIQCMYAKGHRVPVPASFVGGQTGATSPSPPPATYYPPPPPGSAR